MQKLALAEDTSNIDRSSDGLRELKKKKRRVKARKIISSSSDEDLFLNESDNDVNSNKILPDFPQIGNFISKSHLDKSTPGSPSLLSKRISNIPKLCKRTYTSSDGEKL